MGSECRLIHFENGRRFEGIVDQKCLHDKPWDWFFQLAGKIITTDHERYDLDIRKDEIIVRCQSCRTEWGILKPKEGEDEIKS